MNKEFWWSDEAVKMLRERYTIDGPTKLAEKLGTTKASVHHKAVRLGIETKKKTPSYVWTRKMLGDLHRLYPTADRKTLVERIGLPYHALQTMARKQGIFNRTRLERSAKTKTNNSKTCNAHFFDEWSPDFAYTTGFIFADGSITKRKMDIVIGLAVSDICVLEFIKKVTGASRDIKITKNNGYGWQDVAWFTISSVYVVNKLAELGIHPRKTYRDDPFPKVPDEMLPHFIRGYFDGDGSACVSSQGVGMVNIVGSNKFVTGIRDSLVKYASMKYKKINNKLHNTDVCVTVTWAAREDVRKFRDYIYPEGYSFCLERKKTILDNYLNPTKEI